MSAFEEYKLGVKILDPEPTGEGGQVLNENFRTAADLIQTTQLSLDGVVNALGTMASQSSDSVNISGGAANLSQLTLSSAINTMPLDVIYNQSTNSNALIARFIKPDTAAYGSAYIRISSRTAVASFVSSIEIEANDPGSGPHRYGTYGDVVLMSRHVNATSYYGQMHFGTGGVVRMTLGNTNSGGGLGIGVTQPAAKLDVNGNAKFASTATSPCFATPPQVLADAANIAWNHANGTIATYTAVNNRIIANPTSMTAGSTCLLVVTQDATGGRTLTFGNAYKFAGGVTPSLTSSPHAVDIFRFYCDGTKMCGSMDANFS